ncbi:unnamed protein product [Clonostachys chloroleuca]|uniref:Uncharacterized protein n=1 Tax=Clonostachys chloroleuca TaxID=1926264 RepID=A0AA35MG84_9HYPO|nr:unnamed protein product [Clonostachys chloroleuca]
MPGNHENLVSGADEWADQDRRQKAPLSSYDATCSYLVLTRPDHRRGSVAARARGSVGAVELQPVSPSATFANTSVSALSVLRLLGSANGCCRFGHPQRSARKVKTVGMANRNELRLRAAKPTLGQCWKNHVMVHQDEDEDPQLGFVTSSKKYLKAELIGVWILFYCGALWGAGALSTNQPPLHPKNRGTKQPPA